MSKCPRCKQLSYIYNGDDPLWLLKTEYPNVEDKLWYCKECNFVPFYLAA